MTGEQRKRLHLNWPESEPEDCPPKFGVQPGSEGKQFARDPAEMPLVEGAIPGEPIRLSLLRPDGSGLFLILGPSEAVAIADDLLQAVRLRCGRSDWPKRL